MREDVQNLALSELMLYETNTSSNNAKTPKGDEESKGSPPQEGNKMPFRTANLKIQI